MKFSRDKTATLIALFLMFAMAFSIVALPTVKAQWYPECNPDWDVMVVNTMMEVDLDNVGIYVQNITFAVQYPGRDYFSTYTILGDAPGGSLHNIPFWPNETGTYGLKFVVPWLDLEGNPQGGVMYPNPDTPDGSWHSNVAIVEVLATAPVENVVTNIFVSAQPVTGVDEEMFIVFWTDKIPPDIGEMFGLVSSPTGRDGWYDLQVEIAKPDGTTETYVHPYSDPVGGGYYLYTPTEVGNYSVKAIFPGAWKNHTLGTFNRWYMPDESEWDTFIVREERVAHWPDVPLPDDYWMRPISGAANTWNVVLGNWLSSSANVYPMGSYGGATTNYGYGGGPLSPHILWTRTHYPTGSLVDERFGSQINSYGGYQATGFDGNIILDGKIHLSKQKTVHDSSEGWAVWDLATGEELSYDPDARCPSFGQLYWYDSGNQHGVCAYLWRTSGVTLPDIVRVAHVEYTGPGNLPYRLGPNTYEDSDDIVTGTLYELLDAYTGETVCYIANVSRSGRQVVSGRDGSILYYNAENLGTPTAPDYYLQVWNSSAGTMVASQNGTGAWQWRPSGGSGAGASVSYFGSVASDCVHDGNIMWSLNVSMPSIEGPRNSIDNQTASIVAVREGEYVVFGTPGLNDPRGIVQAWFMGVSLEEGREGTKLWENTFTPPYADIWAERFAGGMAFTEVSPEYDVVLYNDRIVLKYFAYDLKTGELLWETPADIENQMGYYGFQDVVYNDTFIAGGTHSGVLRAYDLRTGEVRWEYTAQLEGTESPYGNALCRGMYFADGGLLYTSTDEHSESSPLWRTQGLRCLNATTGEEIWKILFWGTSDIRIADSILLGWNQYDGQVYAFGKGPSGTTVSAPELVPTVGSSVVIKGTVTDQTPNGRRNVNNLLQFSLKGTPAISDEDMQAWMEYLFMQQARPADAKGVEVVLETLDPNGNFYEIGRTTSDINGNYGVIWEPPVPGDYQIIATFAGSASYYGSHATTYMGVAEAPAATPGPTPTPAPMTDMYVLGIGAAAIIAIVAIGLVIILMLRKR